MLSLLVVVLVFIVLLPSSDGIDYGPDVVEGSINNPFNQYCGVNLEEAHRFCHLPVNESFPCPNGDADCPYNLPCWTLKEPCTMPPTPGPTPTPTVSSLPTATIMPTDSSTPTFSPPTWSPMTAISADPRDHYFCGLGFDNLFDCAVPCPGGTSAECPIGQLCYFNTPCDARLIGKQVGSISPSPTDVSNLSYRKFCGYAPETVEDNCDLAVNCPVGDECPQGQFCFVTITCFAGELIAEAPTILPMPSVTIASEAPSSTSTPSSLPTMPSPTYSPAMPSPSISPLTANDVRNFYWCGIDWGDASTRCYLPCVTGSHSECGGGEKCFADVNCKIKSKDEDAEAGGDGDVEESDGSTPSPNGSTWSPTATSSPSSLATVEDENAMLSAERTPAPEGSTWSPTTTPPPMTLASDETFLPTASPILADDMRNFFFCGKNWTDASTRCHKRCMSSLHTECDDDEECFAQADCDGVLTPAPTSLAPIGPPTMSPAPTVSPASTNALIEPAPTFPPVPDLSENPTTPYPSDEASMGPTIALSSLDPTFNSIPTISGIPTATEAEFDTDPPVASSNSPTFVNTDNLEFDPDDPAGYLFCGTDWNHAITECPHRCPSGEGSECPDDMFCYAFTPCEGVGGKVKPTWEPTRYPISSAPTTTEEYWAEKNDDMNAESSTPPQDSWTEYPTPKLSHAPTEDQCRGQPCDYKGECRSALGFCGVGIVYCNSKSSWVPDCGGRGQSTLLDKEEVTLDDNAVPTTSPVSLWEAWVADRDDSATGEEGDGWYDSSGNETAHGNDTSDVIVSGADWDNWAISEWLGQSSSTKWGYLHPYTAVLWALILRLMALL
ncbi:hypothetical protein ACHAXA_011525 [Cyclostephanos tholiformis]|uniref:Uncharacterized protein n=1 Tax=Cyclostephanos tholiformis TaxID=382380 RepID=A0ABD3RT59_9STRA